MRIFKSVKDQELMKLLKDGAVGVLPTDTVYGLVCQASNKQAVERLYDLKSRQHKPGTIIAANIEQLVELGIKYRYLKAVENFWPGPISVIIPCGEEFSYLHRGLKGLAIRIPANKELSQFLVQTGPLLTTSANQPSEPDANNIKEAQKYFGGRVDFYVDGDDLSKSQPSTIIRIIDDAIEVVREGAIKISETGKIET
jgi:L-threonylcarbamoyladenylate synthase